MDHAAALRFHHMRGERWEMVRLQPAPDLADSVLDYAGFVETAPAAIPQREPATTKIPLIINFGPAFRLRQSNDPATAADHGSFVAGLDPGFAVIEAAGPACCMQVDFTPLGAYRFFRTSMRDIAGRINGFAEVCGAEAERLTAQLHDAPDWPTRLVLLDGFVRRRLDRARPPSPAVREAWRRLQASRGRVRIADLARHLDWSRKHLAQRFAVEIGQSPKTVARIMRFGHARDLIAARAHVDWAELALDAGYADQAHLIREVRAMSGLTPVELRRQALPYDTAD